MEAKYIYVVGSMIFFYTLFFIVTPWVFKDLHEYRLKHGTKTYSKKDSITLIDGVCDFGSTNIINTSNRHKNDYIELPRSMNRDNGIEFSYTFWSKLQDIENESVIFVKGSNPSDDSLPSKFSTVTDEKDKTISNDKRLVKCPMVLISRNNVKVRFNTSKKIDNELNFDIGNKDFLHSSPNNPRWFLFTISFKEGYFKTDYGTNTKGVIVDLYINEQHVKNEFIADDSLRLNNSDLHLFPDGSKDKSSQVGNLYYHNWALQPSDVMRIWRAGINLSKGCTVPRKVTPLSASQTAKNIQLNDLGKDGARFIM